MKHEIAALKKKDQMRLQKEFGHIVVKPYLSIYKAIRHLEIVTVDT